MPPDPIAMDVLVDYLGSYEEAMTLAKEMLSAALPAIEAAIREQIAKDIEEHICHETCGALFPLGIKEAACIAREGGRE